MHAFTFLVAGALTGLVLWEIFETLVLPRKVDRRFRLTRLYYMSTWRVYCFGAERLSNPKRRATALSIFGPLSLLGLFVVWGASLIFAFALVYWSFGSPFKSSDGVAPGLPLDLYVSGTTLTTLGLGDVTPRTPAARLIMVVESGLGLGLVALVIGYLPTLYQAFSRRETQISLLDARAGSPPSAAEWLCRSAQSNAWERIELFLAEWERWCAEILESHISFPVLCYFRSQHTNQSWVAAVTVILDSCALCLACREHRQNSSQAQLTFAIARHAVVDITQVFRQKPSTDQQERLSRENFRTICDRFRREGMDLVPEEEAWLRLGFLRGMYEPYLFILSRQLRMELAPWTHPPGVKDNWTATKWQSTHPDSKRVG